MPATVDLTESAVLKGLRFFVLDVLADVAPGDVVRGQQNRVPMPTGPNFVILTPTGRAQLATTARSYTDPTDPAPAEGSRQTVRSTSLAVQMDIYGPAAAENAQIVSTLLRDIYGCDFLRPHHCQPLYCGEPTQLPLITGEKQYEQRWTIPVTLQFNPSVSTSQQFADTVEITVVEVDQHG